MRELAAIVILLMLISCAVHGHSLTVTRINSYSCAQQQSHLLKRTLGRHGGEVTSVAFSPDDRVLASGGADDRVILWDVETGTVVRFSSENKEQVESIAFSPDGKTLASASVHGIVKLWD